MGGGDFRRLRQQDRDAVAARDAVRGKHVGEPVGGVLQPAEADLVGAAVGMHMQDREPPRLGRRPAVADIDADVVARGDPASGIAAELVVVADVGKHVENRRART